MGLRRTGGLLLACLLLLSLSWQRPWAQVPLISSAAAWDGQRTLRSLPPGEVATMHPGTRVLVLPGPADDLLAAQQRRWLGVGCRAAAGTRWQAMADDALLDIHTLTTKNGGVLAAAWEKWAYVWPRDASFVALALAECGYLAQARGILAFLQRVQGADGRFEARYLADESGPPDDREPQLDGSGWALWALSEVILQASATDQPALVREFRQLWQRSGQAIVAAMQTQTGLPAASPDYWEVSEKKLTLGSVAPLVAGLRSAGKVQSLGLFPANLAAVPSLSEQAERLALRVRQEFSPRGYQRYADGGGSDSAVTFLLPPFAEQSDPSVQAAFERARSDLARPAGGLAPGAKWKRDGISWTPETALFGLVAASLGQRQSAAATLDWLDRHRTGTGALPEKVLGTGEPAAVAPLAWTAALVLLTLRRLRV